jgi:uncharacterized protein (DUF433 family)
MKEFERIRVEKGQAYIRDTGITISYLANLISSDQALTEIISSHPDLQMEDLLEVIGYIVNDLLETIAYARNDGISALSTIINATTLIAESTDKHHNEFVESSGQLLVQNAIKGVHVWYQLSSWAQLSYTNPYTVPQKTPFATIVANVLHSLSHSKFDPKVNFCVPENIPDVKIRDSLYIADAIFYTLVDPLNSLKPGGTVNVSQQDENEVTVEIRREYRSQHSIPPKEFFFMRHSQIFLANSIVQQNDSEMQIYPASEHVSFQFSLPIWKENP